jgi:hypothetical protein
MSDRHSLIAFLSTLAAIVLLVAMAGLLAVNGQSVEAVGIGGAVTGLIGVIGTFRPRTGAPGATINAETLNADVDARPSKGESQ